MKAAFVEHAEHSDITDDNKDALLLLCAYRGLAPRVRAVLQAGANAGHINQNGDTALMLACANKQEAAAGELMEATKRAGALDLQAKDDCRSYKRSALHWASAQGLAGTVSQLLALGADPFLTDKFGTAVVHASDPRPVCARCCRLAPMRLTPIRTTSRP